MEGLNLKLENSCCVSLCVSGTPVSDTVCKRCPAGHFSSSDSSAEPCQPHRNCSHLGLKTLRWGSATSDSLCASQDKTAALDCSQHQALCRNGKRPDRKGSGGLRPGWGLRPQRAQIRKGSGEDHVWGTQIPGWGLRPQRAQTPGGGGTQIPEGSEPGVTDLAGLRPGLGAQAQVEGSDPGHSDLGCSDFGGLRPRLWAQTPEGSELGGSESAGLRPYWRF